MWTRKKKEERVHKHWQSLVNNSGPLTPVNRQGLARLIADNVTVFATADGRVGHTDLACEEIDIGDQSPIKQPPHRLGFHK